MPTEKRDEERVTGLSSSSEVCCQLVRMTSSSPHLLELSSYFHDIRFLLTGHYYPNFSKSDRRDRNVGIGGSKEFMDTSLSSKCYTFMEQPGDKAQGLTLSPEKIVLLFAVKESSRAGPWHWRSLLPGVLSGLPKEQLQFTPRSASTPCLLHSSEPHKSSESGGGDALRRGGTRSR
ncbi:hypothetical protein MG293_010661 [Ovis ammon polii]|uniref:Uncharacterized protein n=1 Tax=Ovis ammon polii TaxID=230172 RepID=A0AAD4U7L5_OVIAM|nr:hypothetical protein MG293_010661 [Ovis ammon polii]